MNGETLTHLDPHQPKSAAVSRRHRRLRMSAVGVAAAVTTLVVVASAAPHVGSKRALAPGSVRVAMFVPASGYFTVLNQLIANGVQVAAAEVDGQGGIDHTVKIVFSRIPLKPNANAAAAVRSAKTAGASVVIVPCDVDAQPRLAAAASQAGLLTLTPCDPDPAVSARYPMEWPIGMAGNVEVGQIVGYAYQENAITGYILTSPKPRYVPELTQYFREAAQADHVNILGESTVSLSAPNIAAVAANIKKTQPRAIFTAIFSPYLESIVAGLRADGVTVPVYSTDATDADIHLAQYGAALQNNLVFEAFGFPRPSSQQFYIDYHSTYNHSGADSSFPALGYETIQALTAAIMKASSTQPATINSAFSQGFYLTGVTLADITYPGHGSHIPLAAAGLVRIIRGVRTAMFASYPQSMLSVPNA